ncbi:MAG TPA: restriction endonuclease subunit S, partial [Candidatus Cloacimonadota bacterium]|nr:restriction endonuclease subunit S [Candidatus Cloacimonadota bacterium]
KRVEWGEFKIGELFESSNGNYDIQKEHINGKGDYVVTAGVSNCGILGKSDVAAKVFNENTITIDMFGYVFYRPFKYKMVTHARVFSLKPKFKITRSQGLFIANSFHFIKKKFGYENMCSWVKIEDDIIQLPIKDGKPDFEFMDHFIAELEAERLAELEAERLAELEAYLQASGLNDYTLTEAEERAIRDFKQDNLFWDMFKFKTIFNKIIQGRRLKKDDHKKGCIPFVMAGLTNTGVVNYISNPIAMFPKNSITIDIFGNTFFRNYDFGAGDDTGVYWNDEKNYSKEIMLFFASSMGKSLSGKYDFGKKLRSSQSLDFLMNLPCKDNEPDYSMMESFISAIQKLVIKDVVLYADRKIEASQKIVNRHQK